MKKCILFFVLLGSLISVHAQRSESPTSSEIYKDLQKLQVVGNALYIAAHPDDENTRLISYLSNHLNIETTYLSLTRGDGGQNLIGTEIREQLGILRTQELLAARRIDGGNQRFTRANDFGYSKSPEETKEIWNKKEVLGDIVWTIRQVKPDVIINRFSHDSGRRTHGHHTSSAQLSVEAFDLSGDPAAYPDQLDYTDPWQAERLFFNTSWWFYGSREKFAKADKSEMVAMDIGVYDPLTGLSNTEIAALSRSQHRCQGFGATLTRGSRMEYCQKIKGSMPSDREDFLADLNLTWSRVKGGEEAAAQMEQILEDYDFTDPKKSIPALIALRKEIHNLPENPWKANKIADLDQIILHCAGFYSELRAPSRYATKGEDITVDMELISRDVSGFILDEVAIPVLGIDSVFRQPLVNNENTLLQFQGKIPLNVQDRSPYWLRQAGSLGMYRVDDPLMRGVPENPPVIQAEVTLTILGENIQTTVPLMYTETDPAIGQLYYPFDVLPLATANVEEEVYIFGDQKSKEVDVTLNIHKDSLQGLLIAQAPDGWKVEPSSIPFSGSLKGEELNFKVKLTPPEGQSLGKLRLMMKVEDEILNNSLTIIDYDHIPMQIVLQEASTRLVKVDLKKAGDQVAYIMGAGDKVPENLRQIGYQVDLLKQNDITPQNLKQYDAVIVGIRALNALPWFKYAVNDLLEYVEQGGTLIYQYNTTWRLKTEEFSPYPLKLSRDRVTKEDAEVRILEPDHRIMNFPNKIDSTDFENWVQERGLYFPDEWSDEFTPILSSNDPGETPKDGGLLVATYGSGYFIYSGYSWFRELPAGVPGAFRIFANMISIGKAEP